VAVKLLKKIIFPYFGASWMLISDNEMHFIEKKLETLLKKYMEYGLGYHPLSSEVKMPNYKIKCILGKIIAILIKDWVGKLDDTL